MKRRFDGVFTQQEPIPEAGIDAALEVLRSGRLHRYNVLAGEISQTNALELEFAQTLGAKYCLAVASGGYALSCALKALQIPAGSNVLTNAFTLAPVPGAIASVGAHPIFVETTEDLVVDLADLAQKAESLDVAAFMISHMRGHIAEMDQVVEICERHNITLIEDCAHTMGAYWGDVPSGRHGQVACYSTQTYKHINSGEGGFLITDDPELMARAIMLSGSYMLYETHQMGPEAHVFKDIRWDTPNNSGRMDNLRAAILRPQLAALPEKAAAWNARHDILVKALERVNDVHLAFRPSAEAYVASSFQFRLPSWEEDEIARLVTRCADRGVELKWFGKSEPVGYTSRHDSWRYVAAQDCPNTNRVLSTLLDMRIPLTFSEADCHLIAEIISEEIAAR